MASPKDSPASATVAQHDLAGRVLLVGLVLIVWLAMRLLFWGGYAGADDLFYARYAHDFDRLPMNHMEARLPVVLAVRAGMVILGSSEVAACLGPLACSLGVLAAVAWFVNWPRTLSWESTGSVLLAATVPIDVAFASYPSPAAVSAATTALGMVAVLRGGRGAGLLGAFLLAVAFMSHFLNFFVVGLFCLTALALDWRRHLLPVAACVVFSGGLLLAEMATYYTLTGDWLHRFDFLRAIDAGVPAEGRAGGSKLLFFLMPLQILGFSKPFSFGLLLLGVCGALSYRRMDKQQRILWITTIGYWFWLGYGTVTPFFYRPATRGMHYYTPLVLGICALVPYALGRVFVNRPRLGQAILVLLLVSHPLLLAAGGAWGARVDVSRKLLRYAESHPDEVYLTDVYTLNEMYAVNGFRLPDNVITLNSKWQKTNLLANRNPQREVRVRFPPPETATAILLNSSRADRPAEPEFLEYLEQNAGRRLTKIEPEYRLLFAPFAGLLSGRSFALRGQGGEVLSNRAAESTTDERPGEKVEAQAGRRILSNRILSNKGRK